MKKITSIILVIVLLILSNSVFAESRTFNNVLNSNGSFYAIDFYGNYFKEDDMIHVVNNNVSLENKSLLSFYLYKLTLLDSNDEIYAINCSYRNENGTYSDQYIEYGEIDKIILALETIRKFIEDSNNDSQFSAVRTITYISENGIRIIGGARLNSPYLNFIIGNDNSCFIEDINQIDIIIDYFQNVNKMIEYNKE